MRSRCDREGRAAPPLPLAGRGWGRGSGERDAAYVQPRRYPSPSPSPQGGGGLAPLGQRIAVARDVAFAFAYPHLLEDWREQGAEISFFSPLADEGPSPNADAVFLPGGYPELHAGRHRSRGELPRRHGAAAKRGALIYGECGGYMVLGDSLIDAEGASHRMLGLLPRLDQLRKRKAASRLSPA